MASLDNLAELAADHLTNQRLSRYICGGMRSDQSTITKHADAVGEAFQLLQPMGNVDEADALTSQFVDLREKKSRFSLGERRSRLVEDQQFTAPRQSRRNLYQLPLPDPKRPHNQVRIQITQSNQIERPTGLITQPASADQSEP